MDKKLRGNLSLNILYNLLSVIVPFITAPYLGRVLGVTSVGQYTYVFSIVSYFVMFGLLGISNYGTRSIAQVREDREKRSQVFWETYSMQFLTGVTVALLFILYVFIRGIGDRVLFLIMIPVVATSILEVGWFCSGMEQFKRIVFRNALTKVLNLILILLLVKNETHLLRYCLIMSGCYFLSSIILWPGILGEVDRPRLVFPISKERFKANLLLFVPILATSIYQVMDKIMIGALADKDQLAYYEYADKIISIPALIYVAMGSVMLSRISNLTGKGDQENSVGLISESMGLTILIASFFVALVGATSDELVEIYYGASFNPSAPILMLLLPVVFLAGWNQALRMQYIIPRDLNRINIISTFLGAGINLILNLLLIKKFGAYGATVGTISAYLAIAVYYYVSLRGELPLNTILKKNAWLLLLAVLTIVLVRLIRVFHGSGFWELLLDGACGSLFFLSVVALLGRKRIKI
jgi:O-antigen/teichoic acid export membrane protein